MNREGLNIAYEYEPRLRDNLSLKSLGSHNVLLFYTFYLHVIFRKTKHRSFVLVSGSRAGCFSCLVTSQGLIYSLKQRQPTHTSTNYGSSTVANNLSWISGAMNWSTRITNTQIKTGMSTTDTVSYCCCCCRLITRWPTAQTKSTKNLSPECG